MSAWWKASLNWFWFYNSSFNIPFVPEHRNLWICSQLWGLGCWRAYCWRFMETTSWGWLSSIFVSFLCADLSARVILCCLLISWNTTFFYRFVKPIISFFHSCLMEIVIYGNVVYQEIRIGIVHMATGKYGPFSFFSSFNFSLFSVWLMVWPIYKEWSAKQGKLSTSQTDSYNSFGIPCSCWNLDYVVHGK